MKRFRENIWTLDKGTQKWVEMKVKKRNEKRKTKESKLIKQYTEQTKSVDDEWNDKNNNK